MSVAQVVHSLLKTLRYLWLRLLRKLGVAFGQGFLINPVYVVNRKDNTVSVIDSAARAVVVTVPVGDEPRCVAITPDGTAAFVTNFGSGNLSVIDTSSNTVVATVPVSRQPFGIAITPDGTKAYVTLPNDNKVAVIHLLRGNGVLGGFIDVGSIPVQVAVTPNGKSAYVTNFGSNNASMIDTATDKVVATVNLAVLGPGATPWGIAITPDGVHAYVACPGVGNTMQIEITNNNKVNAKLWFDTPLGQCWAVGIVTVIPPNQFHVYITELLNNGVDVLADQDFSFVDWVAADVGPVGVAIMPNQANVYVTCAFTNKVVLIDTKSIKVIDSIQVGKLPFGIAIKP